MLIVTYGDVVAILLLDAAATDECVARYADVFSVLKQDADGAYALEAVAADGDVAIDVWWRLWRFCGEHDARGAIAVGCACIVYVVPLDENVLHWPCLAPAELCSEFDGRECAAADVIASNADVASFQEKSASVVVRHPIVLDANAREAAVVVHQTILCFDA